MVVRSARPDFVFRGVKQLCLGGLWMYTSTVLVALVGLSAAPSDVGAPTWLHDYSQARKQGREEKKALAVFIGSGRQGHQKLSEEGKLSAEAQWLLAAHYVCVYLDTDSKEGKRLADARQVTWPSDLVVS